MSKKYFYIGISIICVCLCMNGVAASDNISYDNNTDFNSDGDYMIDNSVVNESDTQDKAESVNNSPNEISDFNNKQIYIQNTIYPGNVFNENTGSYFNDLQQAINYANEGEKLIVFEGYYENIILSHKSLTITCFNQYNATIGTLYLQFVSGCNISGFTINSLDLYNAHENVFCNNFFDHYYNNNGNWPINNPVMRIIGSHYNLFESNRIKQNTEGLLILNLYSNSTFRFNLLHKDYYSLDIETASSYLDLDNNLWSLSEDLNVLNRILINNIGSNILLNKFIVPKFDIINYKTVFNFNFNNLNEDLSSLGSMNKINILYHMYSNYDVRISEINNGYAEINLPYNGDPFFLLIDYNSVIAFFEDESFIFNFNTSNYYKNLQEAIDDVYTLNGHTLELYGPQTSGDLFLNKNLTINGLNLIINNFFITDGVSGSEISNFNIKNLNIVNFNNLSFLDFVFENLIVINSSNLNFSNFAFENLSIINSINLSFSNNNIRNIFVNNSNQVNFTSNLIGDYFKVFDSINLVFLRNQISILLVENINSTIFNYNTFSGRLINSANINLFNNTISDLTIHNSLIMDIISNNFTGNTFIEYSFNIVLSGNNFNNIVFLGSNCVFNSNNIFGYIQDTSSQITGYGVYWRNVYNRMTENYYSSLQEAINFAGPEDTLEVYGGQYDNIIILSRHAVTIICVDLYNSFINNLTLMGSDWCNISGFKIGSVEIYNSHENTFSSNYFGGDYFEFLINRPLISLFNSYQNSFISNKIKQNTNDLLVYSQGSLYSVFKFNSFERSWDCISAKPDIEVVNSQIDLDNNLWYDIQSLIDNPYYWNFISNYKNNAISNQNSEVIFDKMIIPRISIINNKLVVDFNYNSNFENISYLGCMNKIKMYIDYPSSSLYYPIDEIINGCIELKPYLFSGFDVLFEGFYITVNRFTYNHNTSKYYNSLQEAIDDVSTLNGHFIDLVNPYLYDVVLYKNLTINANGGSINSLLVNINGSGSKIFGFNIQNLRLINSSYLQILNNQINNLFVNNLNFTNFSSNNLKNIAEIIDSNNLNFSNNQISSILFNNSDNNQLISNKITNYLKLENSQKNFITNSTVSNLFIENSNNFSLITNNITNNLTIYYSNNITFVSNNVGNISNNNSYINCSLNSIKGKINNINGTVIANNNWWGMNNVTINDIMVTGSDSIFCDSWIVVNDKIINGTLIFDFNYNNFGDNLYSEGHIPDGIPIRINNGTHNTTIFVNKGKATYALNNATNITLYIDNWSEKINLWKLNYTNFTSSLNNGWYDESQNLTLSSNNENLTIYYSINHANFISASNQIILNLTHGYYFIQYKAVDNLGNETTVKTLMIIINEAGNLTLPGRVINYNTGKFYNDIQEAINDNETLDGDYIEVLPGDYYENIVINKTIYLTSKDNYGVNIIPNNNTLPTMSLNSNGITVIGFNFINNLNSNGIFLNDVSNCTILQNVFSLNNIHIVNKGSDISYNNWIINNTFNRSKNILGILISNSSDYFIYKNIINNSNTVRDPDGSINNKFPTLQINNCSNFLISENIFQGNYELLGYPDYLSSGDGLYISYSSNITIQNNTLLNLQRGIDLTSSQDIFVFENIFRKNGNGMIIYGDSGKINFNSFLNNTVGIYIKKGEFNATNNWWGNNSPSISIAPDRPPIVDIWVSWYVEGLFIFDPWIVASISPTSYKVSDGKIYESIVTVDLTHNSNGEDVSSIGCIPDGSTVKFYPNGILMANSVIINGKSVYNMSLDTTSTNNYTDIYAQVDREIIYNFVSNIASTEIIIYSSAIDINTGQPLSLTYQLPVNGSVSWFSIFWNQTGLFTADVNLVYNGRIVLTKHIINSFYNMTKNYYRENVFKAIRDLNFEVGANLNTINGLNSSLFQSLILGQIDIVTNRYNLTFDERNFVMNYSIYFADTINVLVYYFGDDRLSFPVSDYDSLNNNIVDLPGNPSIRSSLIFYKNNIYDGHDTGFEGMKSYAIANGNVSNAVLAYWISKNGTFSPGALKAAYGTFLTALLVIYEHDRIADQSAKEFNVTWNRTTPVMISLNNDVTSVYITGESNHRMGMEVYGNESNIYSFRMACSFAFSLVEELVASNTYGTGEIGTVNLGIFKDVAEGAQLISYYSNGYLVVYAEGNNNSVMYIDLANGLVRDSINGTILGAPCYHNPITDIVMEYAGNLLTGQSLIDLEKMGNVSIIFGSTFTTLLTEMGFEPLMHNSGLTFIGLRIIGIIGIPLVYEVFRNKWADIYDSMGYSDSANYLRNNDFLDMAIDSFTPDLSNLDKLYGLPPGTLMSFLENSETTSKLIIGTMILGLDLIRKGSMKKIIKEDSKEVDKVIANAGGGGNKTLFLINLYKNAVYNLKTGSKNVVEGILTKNPKLIGSGIKKIVLGTGLAEFGSFYGYSTLIPKNTWNYIKKLIVNL